MKLSKLTRISALFLILFITALAGFAQPSAPPCGCDFCSHTGTGRSCTMDGVTMTCGYFLAVTLCSPGNTDNPADSMSTVDGFFLSAASGTLQEPVGCLNPAN